MLSLKKKPEAAAPQVPAWHPNFRNYQLLPDIKVVRTAFFVNGTAAFVALGLIVLFVLRELELRSVNATAEIFDTQIVAGKAESDLAISNYRKFQEQEKRVKEIDAFAKSRPVMSNLILRLGETRPKNIALDLVEIRAPDPAPTVPVAIVLRGIARGNISEAQNETNDYVRLLQTDSLFAPLLDPTNGVYLASTAADPVNEKMSFEIQMKFKPAGAPAAAKK